MINPQLSLAHQKFVQAYLRRPNAALAYRVAYPGCSPISARKSGSRLLKQPEVEAELNRLRDRGKSAAVLDLGKKRELLASIINDPEQRTSDRLRALKLDAELAGDIDVSWITPQEEMTGDAMQRLRGLMHAGEEIGETEDLAASPRSEAILASNEGWKLSHLGRSPAQREESP